MDKINDFLAVNLTKVFGTMWIAYLFFLYGFAGKIWPSKMEEFLYWSNTVQLWALPVIMVGQNLLNQFSEKRMQETHDIVMKTHDIIMNELKLIKSIYIKEGIQD